jgi:hypothetical protein
VWLTMRLGATAATRGGVSFAGRDGGKGRPAGVAGRRHQPGSSPQSQRKADRMKAGRGGLGDVGVLGS